MQGRGDAAPAVEVLDTEALVDRGDGRVARLLGELDARLVVTNDRARHHEPPHVRVGHGEALLLGDLGVAKHGLHARLRAHLELANARAARQRGDRGADLRDLEVDRAHGARHRVLQGREVAAVHAPDHRKRRIEERRALLDEILFFLRERIELGKRGREALLVDLVQAHALGAQRGAQPCEALGRNADRPRVVGEDVVRHLLRLGVHLYVRCALRADRRRLSSPRPRDTLYEKN